MRLLLRSMLFIILGSVTAFAQASGDGAARAQEIMKQARAAIGDESKLASLKSITLAGPSRRVFNERETQTEVEVEAVLPDKVRRSTVANPFPGADIQSIEVLNGEQVWFDFVSNMPPGMGGGPGGGGDNVRIAGPGGGPGGPGGGGQRIIMGPGGPGGMGGDEATRQLNTRIEFTRLFLGLLAAPPPSIHVEYNLIGEAKAPDGVADVIEVKGPGETKTRLYIDRATHRILMLSFKGKDVASIMRGRGMGGPGGGGQRQGGGQPGQPGQPGQAGQPGGQPGQPGGQPQMTPEEREARRQAQQKQMQEALAKAPDVDFFWRFAEYKSEGGLNLPRLVTKATGDKLNEEWQISKVKLNPNIKPDKFEKKEKK